MSHAQVFAIQRPDRKLLYLYLMRIAAMACFMGPLVLLIAPAMLFRYQTMKYRFDEDGVHMSWGLLFRREVNLTYARIQDIHLHSGVFQRWLGLADVQIQTASGNAGAEMTIEGVLFFEMVRDFLYQRMRGTKEGNASAASRRPTTSHEDLREVLEAIHALRGELKATREALEKVATKGGDHV